MKKVGLSFAVVLSFFLSFYFLNEAFGAKRTYFDEMQLRKAGSRTIAKPVQSPALQKSSGPRLMAKADADCTPSREKYYHITDRKYWKQLVAGDRADSHLYHQDEGGRLNAQWCFRFAGSVDWQGKQVDTYQIFDRKHGKALVAGDRHDKHVYHQDPDNRENARWMILPGNILMDCKHRKALLAGDNYDQHVYHQDPNNRANANWKISLAVAGQEGPDFPDDPAADFICEGGLVARYLSTNPKEYNYIIEPASGKGNLPNSRIYRPICPPGWGRLGDLVSTNRNCVLWPSIIVRLDPDVVKPPVDFKLIGVFSGWFPGDGNQNSIAFWHPVAPSGFVSLGLAITCSWDWALKDNPPKPGVGDYYCVHNDCVVYGGKSNKIWEATAWGGVKFYVPTRPKEAGNPGSNQWVAAKFGAPPGTFYTWDWKDYPLLRMRDPQEVMNETKAQIEAQQKEMLSFNTAVLQKASGLNDGEFKTAFKAFSRKNLVYSGKPFWVRIDGIVQGQKVGNLQKDAVYEVAFDVGKKKFSTIYDGNPAVLSAKTFENSWNFDINGYECGFDPLGRVLGTGDIGIIGHMEQDVAGELRRLAGKQESSISRSPQSTGTAPGIKTRPEKLPPNPSIDRSLTNVSFSSAEFENSLKKLQEQGKSIGLDKLPGFDKLAFIKGVAISDAVFRQGKFASGPESGQPWACVKGTLTVSFEKFGSVSGVVIVLSRLYKNDGLRTCFVVLSEASQISGKIKEINQEPFKQLKFSKAAFVYANQEHFWVNNDLPSAVKDSLDFFASDASSRMFFPKGENIWLTAELQQNSVLAVPFQVLDSKPPKLLFSAIFPKKQGEKLKLRARLMNKLLPNLKIPIGLNLESPEWLELNSGLGSDLNFSIDSFAAFDLSKLGIDISGKIPLRLTIPAGFKVSSGIALSALIPGTWSNPFGLPLSLGELKLSGTLGGSLPSLGLGGIIDFGMAPLEMSAAFAGGVIVGMRGLRELVGFGEIAKFAGLKNPGSPFSDFEVRNFEFAFSKVDNPELKLQRGETVNGDLWFKKKLELGSLKLSVYDGQGVICKSWCRPIPLGPLKISGAGQDGIKGNQDDGPAIDLVYWPVTQPPYDGRQSCYFTGTVDIPACNTNLEAFLNLAFDKVTLDLNGRLGGVVQARIAASGGHDVLTDVTNGGNLVFAGELGQDFLNSLNCRILGKVGDNLAVKTAISLVGGICLSIKSVKISGSLNDLSSGKVANLTLTGSAFGVGFEVGTDNLAFNNLHSIADQAAGKIREIAENLIPGFPPGWMKDGAQKFVGLADSGLSLLKGSPAGKLADIASRQVGDALNKAAESVGAITSVAESAVSASLAALENVWNSFSKAFSSFKFW